MHDLDLFNIPFNEPLFSIANPTISDINNAHHFNTRTTIVHPDPQNVNDLTTSTVLLDVYEICEGIYVSVSKQNVGPAPQADQTQIDTDYWDSNRLNGTFQQQSRAEQERDYLVGIQKIFKYYENKLTSSPSLQTLFRRLKFEPFIGSVDPASSRFGRINNLNNSLEVYIPGGIQPVGYKRASVIIMPPNSMESLTMAYEATARVTKPGLGSYGIVQIDPFISSDVVNYPGQTPAKFAENPALALLHELIHVMHDLRGLSTPIDEGLALNPPVPPASPQWSKRVNRVTADEPNLKKMEVPFEELLTFNRDTVSSNLAKGRKQANQYVTKLFTGEPARRGRAEFKGALEQIETELSKYYQVPLSPAFVDVINTTYGISYNWTKRRFNVGPGAIRSYVKDAFDVTEKMLATELNISTRQYYAIASDYANAAVFFVDLLDDTIFNVNVGLVSQDTRLYTPLPVVNRQVTGRTYRRRGFLRRILCNDMTYHGVVEDTEFSEIESTTLNEDSEVDTDRDRVESLVAEDVPNDLEINHVPTASLGNDIFELSSDFDRPDYILDDHNVIGGEFTLDEPIGAMINGIMLSPDEEERPIFNRDLMGALDSESEVYAPKIKAMDKVIAGVNAGLGYLGWAAWSAIVISDIVDSIRVKKINYTKFAQDFMMLIPFYCAYTNASEGEYEKATANAEIDAFSLFASDGSAGANIQLFVASLAINTMYPILQKEEAYTTTMNNFIDKYKNDINDYLFNVYGQWDMNVADRLLNESYIAANGLSNVLLTIKRVMTYDQKHNGYSEDDQRKIAAANEKIFASFPKIIATFQHNSMVANMYNAGQMFTHIMWPKIQETIETYSEESEKYFSDFLEKGYKDGIIGTPAYQRYKAKIADTFNGSASLNKVLDLFNKRVAEVTQSADQYGAQLDTITSHFGNLVHLDVAALSSLKDLYGKFDAIADGNLAVSEIGREDRVIRIKGDQTGEKAALILAAKPDFSTSSNFSKKRDYTVGFWVRMPRQGTNTTNDKKFLECELGAESGQVKELGLSTGTSGFRLDVLNNVFESGSMRANNMAYNQWTHIMVSHESTKVKLYLNGSNVGTNTKIERQNGIIKQPILTFFTLNQDYLIDNVSFYDYALTDNQVGSVYYNEISKVPKDYWGERLEYNKTYYLKCAFLRDSSFKDEVPLQLTRTGMFTENNRRFPYLYKGIKIELEYKYTDDKRYVEPDDEFFIKFSGRSTYFAIRDNTFWWQAALPLLAVTDQNHMRYAETFKLSFLKRAPGAPEINYMHAYYNRIVGIGADEWKAYRGTNKRLWFLGEVRPYIDRYLPTFSFTYDHLVNSTKPDRLAKVMWGFVPEDPGWTEK
ncbi:LamG-like jellyroll fold domain-containing protein [Furfurilactobacillus entadae]|uniref:LamG-like jellyroll fold domain-containing protein n=1 Tax=Furfurilactobacillus entadae TaxID=2922307 RepID=UPI0035E91CDC